MVGTDDTRATSLLLSDIPMAALAVAVDGAIEDANPSAVDLLGEGAVGAAFADIVGCGLRRDLGGDSSTWRTEARTTLGVPFLVDLTATHRSDGTALVLLRPVTDDAIMGESFRQLDIAFETAPIGMAFFDTEGRYLRVNQALCRLLGRPAEALIGTRDSELTHPDDRQSDVDAAWRILRGELDTWQTEKRFVRPDGSVVWAIANMSFLRDDERLPLTWLGQFQDITGRKALEEQLRDLAEKDPLTGVANRRRLERAVRDALASSARHGHGGALIYIDLDGFKSVNDSYGHDAGDALLREAATAMVDRCRGTDVIARVGGDEFAILLPIATPHQARTVERSLHEVLTRVWVEHEGVRITLAATLGSRCFGPNDRLAPEELVAAADRAMYAARRGPSA